MEQALIQTETLLEVSSNCPNQKESGTEIGHSLEFDFVVPPPHSWVGL